jgi:hypothetical protein
VSETGDQFQIQEPGCQPLRHGINRIGEILYEQIRNGVAPVDDVKHLEGSPYIFKMAEGIMTSSPAFVTIQ